MTSIVIDFRASSKNLRRCKGARLVMYVCSVIRTYFCVHGEVCGGPWGVFLLRGLHGEAQQPLKICRLSGLRYIMIYMGTAAFGVCDGTGDLPVLSWI